VLTEGFKKRPCFREGKIMPCDFKSAKVCIAEYEEFFDDLAEKLQKLLDEIKQAKELSMTNDKVGIPHQNTEKILEELLESLR